MNTEQTRINIFTYKNIYLVRFYWLTKLYCLIAFFCEILGNMFIAIVCKPGCDVMNFEVNLIFLTKLFFLDDQKVVTKTWIYWERKKLLRWNKKNFLSFLKGFQSSSWHNFFGRWESDFNLVRIMEIVDII